MALSITSANAVFMLSIAGVYPTAQQLQEFGVDDAFTTDAVATTETQVGVDGFGVAGYVPRSPTMTIRLLASSRSFPVFEDWIAAQDALQDVLYGAAIVTLPAIGRKYTCYRGSLLGVSTIADARKVLQNREFHVQWLPSGIIPAVSASPL
jgi:hypothetical protein